MNNLSTIQTIAVYLIPLICAITLHEAAHAYMAYKYGDNTAKMAGRLSLNPLHHIDPIGTILFPLLSIVMGSVAGGSILFGWAKPVPINFSKLYRPKHDLMWIALAGPLSNLAMALIWTLLMKGSTYIDGYFGVPLQLMGQAGISINLSLMLINLLPILPLDGGRVLFSLLPNSTAHSYAKSEPYGMWILIALIFSGALGVIISPIYSLIVHLLLAII